MLNLEVNVGHRTHDICAATRAFYHQTTERDKMLVGQSGEPWSHRFYQFSQTTFSIKSIIIGGVEQNEIVENCKRLAIGFVSLSERNLQITMVYPRCIARSKTNIVLGIFRPQRFFQSRWQFIQDNNKNIEPRRTFCQGVHNYH